MRILTYKRTHTGDPNTAGTFGINDCMGSVRSLLYDAVIGVGGIGAEPRDYKIDGKITWVGIYPTKRPGGWRRGPLVNFQRFVLFDAGGPVLSTFAPALSKRLYQGKVRYLLKGYRDVEKAEAEQIIQWAMDATAEVSGEQIKVHKGVRLRCKRKKIKNEIRV